MGCFPFVTCWPVPEKKYMDQTKDVSGGKPNSYLRCTIAIVSVARKRKKKHFLYNPVASGVNKKSLRIVVYAAGFSFIQKTTNLYCVASE